MVKGNQRRLHFRAARRPCAPNPAIDIAIMHPAVGCAQVGVLPSAILLIKISPIDTICPVALAKTIINRTSVAVRARANPTNGLAIAAVGVCLHIQARKMQQVCATDVIAGELQTGCHHAAIAKLHHQPGMIHLLGACGLPA